MEINIKMNVAEIGTIINEVACAISTSKNLKNASGDVLDALVNIAQVDIDDEDLPFSEKESNADDKNASKPVFDWDAFEKGDIEVLVKNNGLETDFLKKCDERGLKCFGGKASDLNAWAEQICMPMVIVINDAGRICYNVYDIDKKLPEKVVDWSDYCD